MPTIMAAMQVPGHSSVRRSIRNCLVNPRTIEVISRESCPHSPERIVCYKISVRAFGDVVRKDLSYGGRDTHAGAISRVHSRVHRRVWFAAGGVRNCRRDWRLATVGAPNGEDARKKGLIRRQPGVPRSIEVLVSPNAIPKWKGKRISRTVWEWSLRNPAARRPGQGSGGKATVYRFKIILQDSDPEIWRRIETKDVPLEQLHALIQTAMGWTNSHLHQFEIAGSRYTDPRFMMDDLDDLMTLRDSTIVACESVIWSRSTAPSCGWAMNTTLETVGSMKSSLKK